VDKVEFRLERETLPPAGESAVVDILVNGTRLQEMARDAEALYAAAEGCPERAGQYAGLDPSLVASGHFLGRPATVTASGELVRDRALLRCACGEPNCWPLAARIELTRHTVTWSGFRGRNSSWDLGVLGPLEFERDQYEAALIQASGDA
jgi:hypothetical protein